MCVGNRIGVALDDSIAVDDLFAPAYGSFIVELAPSANIPTVSNLVEIGQIGETTADYVFHAAGETLDLANLQEVWENGIASVFPYRSGETDAETEAVDAISFETMGPTVYKGAKIAKPRVIIPVFPGNNCEYDTAAAFERAGAEAQTLIVNNLTPSAVAESTQALVDAIHNSQIIMIPGGFSGGDEPDGSAKFITAFFRAPAVTEAVRDLLNNRDGLMLGICNGLGAHQARSRALRRHCAYDRGVPDAHVQHHRTPPEPSCTHTRRVEPVAVACQDGGGRYAHHRHLPWRGTFRRFRRHARPAHRKRAGCHTVR